MDKDYFDKYFNEDNDDEEDEYSEEYESGSAHKNKSSGKTFTRGFVTALVVCAVAVGAAIWTTVNNVNEYLYPEVQTDAQARSDAVSEPDEPSSAAASKTEDAQAAAQVSGVKADGNSKAESDSDTDSDEEVRFTVKPLNTEVIGEYSEAPVYNSTLRDYRAHPAVDYRAEIDDKVRCMGKGIVTDIYTDEMLGNVVVVEHSESVQSYYCGLAKTALVQVGDEVQAGDFVGTVYSIPCETAEQSHVHVAVKADGEWVNPENYMETEKN